MPGLFSYERIVIKSRAGLDKSPKIIVLPKKVILSRISMRPDEYVIDLGSGRE
jgi:hypothetical protein